MVTAQLRVFIPEHRAGLAAARDIFLRGHGPDGVPHPVAVQAATGEKYRAPGVVAGARVTKSVKVHVFECTFTDLLSIFRRKAMWLAGIPQPA